MNEGTGWRWLPVTAAVIGLDQFTKLLVVASHQALQQHPLAAGARLEPALQSGRRVQLSRGASGWQRWFFTVLALVVGGAILIWMRRLQGAKQWLLSLSLASFSQVRSAI